MADGKDCLFNLTRSDFYDICQNVFNKCLVPLKLAIDDANFAAADIDEIVMVGGSTRMLKIQRLVSEHFGGKGLNNSLHCDEAIAIGAAVQGAIIAG